MDESGSRLVDTIACISGVSNVCLELRRKASVCRHGLGGRGEFSFGVRGLSFSKHLVVEYAENIRSIRGTSKDAVGVSILSGAVGILEGSS
jgi:hypothetical protein